MPGLAASTHAVSAHDLAADVDGGSRFEQLLRGWGFARGRERDFQGPSLKLDRVVSRTLAFGGRERRLGLRRVDRRASRSALRRGLVDEPGDER